jgi:hypothetical protein
MGRASSSKKVQRAARAAGRPGTGRNWLWPAAVLALVALGVTLVWVSRGTDQASAESPTFGDHWHAAYGIYTCDKFADPLADAKGDPVGIHTHQDGLIHIHPTSAQATGKKATLGVFADDTDLKVEDDRLEIPGGKTYVEGKDKCGGKPGIVQVAVWDDSTDESPTIVTKDMTGIKLGQNQLLTIAFAPKGAKLPKPPSEAELAAPSDLQQQQGSVPSVPVSPAPGDTGSSSTTAPAGAAGSTTSSSATSTTAAPGNSTTSSTP